MHICYVKYYFDLFWLVISVHSVFVTLYGITVWVLGLFFMKVLVCNGILKDLWYMKFICHSWQPQWQIIQLDAFWWKAAVFCTYKNKYVTLSVGFEQLRQTLFTVTWKHTRRRQRTCIMPLQNMPVFINNCIKELNSTIYA